jgi:Cu+-exporting ATPase
MSTPAAPRPSGAAATGPEAVGALVDHVDLEVGGMTCAACALRIEKRLNKLPGVTATVNYATERAAVDFDPAQVVPSELLEAVAAIGYTAALPAALPASGPTDDETDDRSTRRLSLRLAVAIAAGVPVLVLSMVPGAQFRGWQWVAFVLATPVATWSAWPFHRSAALNARHGTSTMDTLVSVGVSAAYLWSAWALLFTRTGDLSSATGMSMGGSGSGMHPLYLEVASTTVALILLGRWFEARSKRRAGGALRALLHRSVADVEVIDDDGTTRIAPATELRPGQRFLVRPGERIATDGTVDLGSSAVDASLVTGESLPVEVGPGDAVTGGTISTDGRLVVRATRVGADTTLARMARLVEQAQNGKAPVQRLADRVAGVFVPIVFAIAIMVLLGWWLTTGELDRAVRPAIAVLIIACPCALGLATPTALLVGTGRGAQLGILITGPEVLERTRRIDTIVLDKTGTVTTATMRVSHLATVAAGDRAALDELLRTAAAVEQASEHPIARAVVTAAHERGLEIADVGDFLAIPGSGARGVVDGRRVEVRRASAESTGRRSDGSARVATVVEVVVDDAVVGTISLEDPIKPTSRDGIAALHALGLRTVLLTGDHERVAAAVAAEVGIAADDVRAGVDPAGKLAAIVELQRSGAVVAMLGDGVNDAAALAAADLGIAMGSGTDVAMEAADITLVRADLPAAADAIALGRRTLAVIKGNLFWAFAYNVAAIPVAASGLLSPVIASAAMACSSIFVVSNSLRLRRFRR